MELNYIKSQSYIEPELIDTTSSKSFVYLRQNIVKKKMVDTNDIFYYEYDEAKLTNEEYQEYLKELNNIDTLQVIEDLKTENQGLNEQISMLTECLLEMSEIVYA